MLLLITYDLKQPDRDYTTLYESIKQCSSVWWHYLESVWIIRTEMTANQCFDKIHPNMDNNDYIFIVDISHQTRQGWLPKDAWEWIKSNDV